MKLKLNFKIAMLAFIFCIFGQNAFSQYNGHRGPRGEQSVCFYTDSNFGGQRFCSGEGSIVDLSSLGMNDSISSIQIADGYNVQVFVDSGFRGASRMFDQNIYDLSRFSMNDRISSVIITRQERRLPQRNEQVCFYKDANFRGRELCLRFGDSVADLASIGMNDQISSVRIPRGITVTLFSDARFRGGSLRLDADMPNLATIGWNDIVSSFYIQ